MKRLVLLACMGSAAALAFAVPACSDNVMNNPEGSAGDAADEPAPIPSPFGLDTRPPNPTCLAPQRPPAVATVKFDRVFMGLTLSQPMMMSQIAGDPSRFFVALRGGTLVSFATANPVDATKTTVLTIPIQVNTSGEGGFLGFALHPQFLQNGRVYLTFTSNSGTSPANMRSVIAVMTSADGGKTFPANTFEEILTFDQPFTNHNGSDIAFGKDGYLYLSFGDGGSGGDPLNNGQNKNTTLGKILRIDVDGPPAMGKNYGIPSSNPFAGGGGEASVFAYGFRNPFRFSVDSATGLLWVGDVGQNLWEEIDPQIVNGGNYGWRFREGMHCYNPANNCPTAGLIEPIWEYDHSQGNAVIGGVVYRGKSMPALVGTYFFADYGSGNIWSMSIGLDGKPTVTVVPDGGGGGWVDFAEDNDGEMYAVSLFGYVHKLNPAGVQMPSTFPDTLSKTGCVDPKDPRVPASGLIPFAPHSPLWSDGAQKDRWMALPDTKQITVLPDGDFDFPNGTVLMKTFSVSGKRVETRLFVRHDDGGWAGYSYEWNDQETDAALLPANKSKPVGNQTWYYPSRPECMRCHTQAAGRSLGPEIGQLNWDFTYTQTNRLSNQLRTLEHIGMFDKPLSAPPEMLTAYPDPLGMAPVDQRARAYLHTNCSMCHRPLGGGGGNMDFRWSTSLFDTQTCNAAPITGDLGILGAKIVVPGDPSKSLLVQRPSRTGADRMPPLATSVIDTQGVSVLTNWVTGLTSCPGPSDAGTD